MVVEHSVVHNSVIELNASSVDANSAFHFSPPRSDSEQPRTLFRLETASPAVVSDRPTSAAAASQPATVRIGQYSSPASSHCPNRLPLNSKYTGGGSVVVVGQSDVHTRVMVTPASPVDEKSEFHFNAPLFSAQPRTRVDDDMLRASVSDSPIAAAPASQS